MSTLLEIEFVPISQPDLPDLQATRLLTGSEKEEWIQLPTRKRKADWLAGRIACKKAVRKLYFKQNQIDLQEREIQIARSNGFPPAVNLPNIAISITHAEGLACAIAILKNTCSLAVGLDLEKIQKPDPDWIQFAFDDREKECARDQPWKFFQYWTAKEAVLKALGLGLTVALTDLSVQETPQMGELSVAFQGLTYLVKSFRFGNYWGAYCITSSLSRNQLDPSKQSLL